MTDSRYDSSDTKNSDLGLTRPSILGSGAELNKPGSRKGIQGISLTPARSLAPSRVLLSSGRPREQYQSVYANRLGGSLTNSAPNISNLNIPSDRQAKDNTGESFTPRRANISSLRLTPRRVSQDPCLTKLEQSQHENLEEKNAETPPSRRGSDIIGISLQRQLILEEGGFKRNPAVHLSRTHSDIEYSQRLRRVSRNSATYSPKSPDNGANGNGENVKLDSGNSSPNSSKFIYDSTAKSSSDTNDTGIVTGTELVRGNSDTLTYKSTGNIGKIVVEDFDSVDAKADTVNRIEKLRYDSGYHSPRYEKVAYTDNQNQTYNSVEVNRNENQSASGPKPAAVEDLTENKPRAKGNRQYSNETYGNSLEIGNKVDSRGTVNSVPVGYNKDFSEIQTTKQKPISRGPYLASTPENSVLKTSLNSNSGQGKQGLGLADMSASRNKQTAVSPAVLSQTHVTEDFPTPQPRTRRRLTKRISFKKVEDDEYIGFASLPEQVHRKAVRRGFEFTLMVVEQVHSMAVRRGFEFTLIVIGETGLGKSTLINSLFLTDLYKDRKITNMEERIQKTVDLEKKELEIEERGVKLKLTIVDTPGFNDAVNAEESWKPIVNYVDSQFDAYFQAESGLNRKNIKDTRVHCCLYFISPYGHGLRPVDVLVMKKLHNKVNIVPLIAKSDMLTKPECKRLKQKIIDEIEKHRIHIYQFPDCDSDEDEEFKQQDKELKASIPFAVVGSNTVVEAPGGKKIRGRMYPWGIVEVENPSHCDFIRLRQMLIGTHMQDLKDVTCDTHYENYRAEHISEQMGTQRRDRNKLKRDSAANMEAALDTDILLQQKEAEIQRMREMMRQMEAKIRNQNGPQVNGRVGHV